MTQDEADELERLRINVRAARDHYAAALRDLMRGIERQLTKCSSPTYTSLDVDRR